MSEPRQSQFRKTAKHSAIYAFGTMLRRLTGLIMLPIYTRYLTPADYGAVELLTMAIELAGILIGLRISQAMFRYYILAESDTERKQVVSTVLITVIATSSIGALILYVAAEPLSRLLFGSSEFVYEFQLFAFTLVANAGAAAGMSYLRARQMPIVFVSVGAASLALQVALNIYFVVMLELHVTGVVYSALISGMVLMVGLSLYLFSQAGFNYSIELAKKLFRFVYPLIIASLGAFYAAYADKYFLRVFGSLSDVGLYALAARVSSILATLFEAFNMSWGADRFEIVKKDNARVVFEKVFRFVAAFAILIGAGIAMFASDLFLLMTTPEFYPAASIVPLMVLTVLARIAMIFNNFGAHYHEQTSIMARASWLKAALATVGYIALIPEFGVYGAAITLMIASMAETIWVTRSSTRLYDMGLHWKPVFAILATAVVIVATGLVVTAEGWQGFALRVLLYLGLILAVYMLPVWSQSERDALRSGLGGLMGRLKGQS